MEDRDIQKVLIIDDEASNLEILREDLTNAGYDVLSACDGKQGWELLEKNPDVSVILLDRMMPVMDGMEFVGLQTSHEKYKHIPVIMQTGAALNEQIREGIQAGVYYYLIKPYDVNLLLAIVEAAINDARKLGTVTRELKELQTDLSELNLGLKNLISSKFEFRTLGDAGNIANLIANITPDPRISVLGITELMVNAVEHGNLGITFEEKSQLLINGKYENEIKCRLAYPENLDKKATVETSKAGSYLEILIADTGNGFNWENYLNFSAERGTLPNGRGIAMAGKFSFDKMEFISPGNKVLCCIKI